MTEARRLEIVTAAELTDMIFPPVSYVVDGYIAEGLTVLAGRPKTGKSWLALNLATAVASGGAALGSIPVEAGDVLYLALEEPTETAARANHAGRPRPRTPALSH